MDMRHLAASGTVARDRRRTRVMQLVAGLVLAGLWLMHGVSATTAAGCRGVPVMMTSSMSAAGAGSGATGRARAHAAAFESGPRLATDSHAGHPGSMHAGCGETCLSGQPPSAGDLLLGLLTCFALLALVRAVSGHLPRASAGVLSRLRRRGRPPPGGTVLLTTVCVSRT